MNRFLLKESALLGVLWGAWARRDPEGNAKNMAQLVDWYRAGSIRPHISGTHPLVEAAAALQTVMDRGVLGKLILTTGANG